MKKKLLILGAGYLQVPGIIKAKHMGYYVIAADRDPNAEGFRYADKNICVSTTDSEGILKASIENKIDGIMTLASDRPVNVVAQISKKLGFNFMTPEDALAATNKDAMRLRLKEKNIPIPKFEIVKTETEFNNVKDKFGNVYITKPADNSGGRGICLVNNMEKADEAFRYSQKYSASGTVLVEEYMEGKEVSIEAITYSGKTEIIAITDKLTSGAPYFVEVGHTIQSSLCTEIKERIMKVTVDTINAIGIVNGPSHTEVKVTDDGPKVVEIGARLGGGNITSDLVPLATGVDILSLCIRLAMGEEIHIGKKKDSFASLRHIVCPTGTITGISGVEKARLMPGVERVEVIKSVGDEIHTLRSCDDRVAFVIATGQSYEEAVRNAEAAASVLRIDVE